MKQFLVLLVLSLVTVSKSYPQFDHSFPYTLPKLSVEYSKISEYSHHALIIYEGVNIPVANVLRYHLCGGTLISKKHVLTSASCVIGRYPKNFTVYFLVPDLQTGPAHGLSYHSEFVFMHQYDPKKSHFNDIALIVLTTEVKSVLKPALLPQGPRMALRMAGYMFSSTNVGGKGTVFAVVKAVESTLVSCRNFLNVSELEWKLVVPWVFCAGGTDRSAVSIVAPGDIGSGLVSVVKNGYEIQGVASAILPLTFKNNEWSLDFTKPSVFTNVYSYKEWIKTKMNTKITPSLKTNYLN